MRNYPGIINRLEEIIGQISEQEFQSLSEDIGTATHVALFGVGREGLVIKAFAMRLYHLGINVSVVGEMVCQPLNPGDILLVSAGPGWISTVEALTHRALSVGASVIVMTATPNKVLQWAPQVKIVEISAKTMAPNSSMQQTQEALPMGSEYEISLWVFFDLLIQDIQQHLSIDSDQMIRRHTNLE